MTINVRDGSEKLLSERRWFDVWSLEWLRDGSGLLMSGSDKMAGSNQIWLLSPNGARQRTVNHLLPFRTILLTGFL